MKRVLVVEDNKNNMRLLVKLLNKHGYETIKAETGEQLCLKSRIILLKISAPMSTSFNHGIQYC